MSAEKLLVRVLWATELERRAAEVEDGSAETFDWKDVEQEVLSELAQRRANRTSQTNVD